MRVFVNGLQVQPERPIVNFTGVTTTDDSLTSRTNIAVSGIPDPSAQPNGNRLTVSNGVAAWSPGANSGGTFINEADVIPTIVVTLGSAVVCTKSVWIPADATNVKIRVSNRSWDTSQGAYVSNTATVGCNYALGADAGTGSAFDSGKTITSGTFTLPASGVEVAIPIASVQRGANGRVIMAIGLPAGAVVSKQDGSGDGSEWRKNGTGSTVNPLPSLTAEDKAYCDLRLSFDTNARRLIVAPGDSISVPYHVSYLHGMFEQLGPLAGIAVDNRGIGGKQVSDFIDDTVPMSLDTVAFRGADVWMQAGVNDLHANVALETLQTNTGKFIRYARAQGCRNVYSSTIGPALSYLGANNATRLAYNAWLKTKPYQIAAVLDLDPIIGGQGGNPSVLLTIYDIGDGLHLNTAANDVLAPFIVTTLG
jgi:hypothetical protein